MCARSRLHSPEILNFAKHLWAADQPRDILSAEKILSSNSYGIGALVSLPIHEIGSYFPPFPIPDILQTEYIIPYFGDPYIYFIRHEQITRPILRVDYTITFDSNFAGYVNRFIKGELLGRQQDKVIPVIHHILNHDLNFDMSFYLVENIKKILPTVKSMEKDIDISPRELWESLDDNYRENLVNLELFQNIDIPYYRETGKLKFNIDVADANDRQIANTHWLYASADGLELIDEFIFFQKTILLQLITILKIQFSSRRGPKNKLREFLEFVQQELVFFDRETIMAHKYFKDRNTIPILETVNKGKPQRDLMEKIDNLAWDMTVPRYMERMFPVEIEGDCTIPFFLTLDLKLGKLISCYPIKAAIIDYKSGRVLSIPKLTAGMYFTREGYEDINRTFFSEEKQEQRFLRKAPTLETLEDRIKEAYRELSIILGSTSD